MIPVPGGVDGMDDMCGGGPKPMALADDEPDELVLVLMIVFPLMASWLCNDEDIES